MLSINYSPESTGSLDVIDSQLADGHRTHTSCCLSGSYSCDKVPGTYIVEHRQLAVVDVHLESVSHWRTSSVWHHWPHTVHHRHLYSLPVETPCRHLLLHQLNSAEPLEPTAPQLLPQTRSLPSENITWDRECGTTTLWVKKKQELDFRL